MIIIIIIIIAAHQGLYYPYVYTDHCIYEAKFIKALWKLRIEIIVGNETDHHYCNINSSMASNGSSGILMVDFV